MMRNIPGVRSTSPLGFFNYINSSDRQHAVASRDFPAINDLPILHNIRECMKGARRTDMGGHRVSGIAGCEAVRVRRLDDEMLLVVQNVFAVNVEQQATLPCG